MGGMDGRRRETRKKGKEPMIEHQIDDSAWVWRMSGLTRDGTTKPVSRGQIFSRERGQETTNLLCSVDHKQNW